MSSSDDSDSDLEDFVSSFKAAQAKLKEINDELTKSIETLQVVRKVAKTVEEMCEKKDVYTEFPTLHKYLIIWKEQNRINHNGSRVLVRRKEAREIGLPKEGWYSVYAVCEAMHEKQKARLLRI